VLDFDLLGLVSTKRLAGPLFAIVYLRCAVLDLHVDMCGVASVDC
jgi:hypothetical protein